MKTPTNFLHPHRVVIVAARMTSKRFPGKPLQKIGDKTVIQMCLERCKQSKVDEVVLAIPWEAESDDLGAIWVPTYRPPSYVPEWDVVARIYGAALEHGANIIVRVTGDCPLIDPEKIDEVVSLLKATRADYCANEPYIPGLGLEVFTFEALEKAELYADDADREDNPTRYMRTLPKQARFYDVERPVNLSIDTPEDLECVRGIVEALGPDCRTKEIVEWIQKN